MKVINLEGKTFERLTVVNRADTTKNGSVRWNCICSCGNNTVTIGSLLKSGTTTSCGCRRDELIGNRFRLPDGIAIIRNRYTHYKESAVKRSISFNISFNEFENIIFKKCYYCNSDPYLGYKPKTISVNIATNGIDRVDSTKGYSIDNIVPCCWQCNRMKSSLDQGEFFSLISKIYKHSIEE